jgi:hypothetical protein
VGFVTELVAKFGFEVDEKPLKDLDAGIEAIKHGLLGLAAEVGASSFALFEMAHHLAESREEMSLLAQRVGISVESFTALKFAANLVHVEAEDLAMSMGFLNRALYHAGEGSAEVMGAFRKLGISHDFLKQKGLQTDQVLGVLADRFKAMPNGPMKGALAMQLFGRAGAKMLPLLNQGSEGLANMRKIAEEIGVIMSPEKAEQAENLVQQMKLFNIIITSIKNTVAGALIPVFSAMVEDTNRWLMANREIIKSNLIGFVKGVAANLQVTWKAIRIVANAVADLGGAFGGAETMTRIFLGAIGVLSSLSVLFGIGKVVQAVRALGVAFEWSAIQAALMPILIGAGIAALLLVMEDVLAFFQGRSSLTELLLTKLGVNTDLIRSWGTSFVKMMGDIWDGLIFAIKHPIDTLLGMVLGPIGKISSMLGISTSNVDHTKDVVPSDSSMARIYGFDKNQSIYPQDVGNAAGAANSSSMPGAPVSVTAPISIMLPPGTDAGNVADRSQNAVTKGMEEIWSRTQRATASGVGY